MHFLLALAYPILCVEKRTAVRLQHGDLTAQERSSDAWRRRR